MRQERLLPEQQEVLCNKSQQNTRWKLIALYFVIRACFTKWKQLSRSLVCVRTSVDVFHNLCDLSIFIQGHTGSWLVWLGNECERCWTEHLSHQRCGLFLQKRMSYISATIVLGFLLAAIPLSLIYTRISLPTTCWL